MKYGMNLLLWTSGVTQEHFPLLQSLKEWGFDGVELPMFDLDVSHYASIGAELKKTGLESTAVTVCSPEHNPISPDAAIRTAALTRLKLAIDCCAAAGSTHLCGPIHSALGEFSGTGRTADEWNRAKDILSQAGDYAKEQGVTLVVEYLNRFECYFLNSAADAGLFCRELGHSHVKTMYDTFHANIEEKSITQAVKACADQLVHVHISENDRSTPGDGGVNWDESFRALKNANYDGWLTIEAFGLALPELAAATRVWRRMFPSEEYLAKNGLQFMKSSWEGRS
ncbi:MAG: sugar phosphate isomerase/epimerase [Planctomycetaceae bacterium]|nr:sugar phosphate isomerase/epimerase [Planctomycetaceae bacterium]